MSDVGRAPVPGPPSVRPIALKPAPCYRGAPWPSGKSMRPSDNTLPAGEEAPAERREPAFNLPFVVMALVLILLVIHLGASFLSDVAEDAVARQFAFIPGRLTLGLWPDALSRLLANVNENPAALRQAAMLRHFHVLEDGPKIWTLLTYAFLHGGWAHVGLNSVWIIAFGPPIARRIGPIRFLLLFATASIAGALVHWAFNPLDFTPLIGASAGDSGLMAAATRFIFEPGGPLSGAGYSRSAPRSDDFVAAPPLGRLLRERRVQMFLVVWFIGNFVFGAGAQSLGLSEGPVAWLAHVGGFTLGLVAFPLFDRKPPNAERHAGALS
jgi:membrane associated rhomboid family serine protease